jgi:DNA-binding PadR family transcriptional regulator
MLSASAARNVTLGAIYAALDRTVRKGLATSWMGESTPVRGGRARRHYAVTPAGEETLLESRLVRELLWSLPAPARP